MMIQTQYNKIVTIKMLILTGLCLFFCLAHLNNAIAASKPTGEALDRIIAVVNDTVITQSELDTAIDSIKKRFSGGETPLPPEAVLRKQVLDQIINRKLQLQLAEQAGIKANDTQINKAIGSVASQNGVTVKELYQKVASTGMSESDYRKEIRDEIILQEVQQQEIGPRITIAPQEVDDFMRSADWKNYNNKEYHLEDILIALPDTPSSKDIELAKKQASNILSKIHRGQSFQELALAESGGGSALQGGDLGWRKLPQIPSAFASALVQMKENDVAGPILTPNGFHIVRLIGIRETGKQNDGMSQRKQVEQLIYQRKFEEALQSWITKLRGTAFINLHPES